MTGGKGRTGLRCPTWASRGRRLHPEQLLMHDKVLQAPLLYLLAGLRLVRELTGRRLARRAVARPHVCCARHLPRYRIP